ncbi:MAG: ABC transporter substrate-binding protein [Methyloligellaceae bacterium]
MQNDKCEKRHEGAGAILLGVIRRTGSPGAAFWAVMIFGVLAFAAAVAQRADAGSRPAPSRVVSINLCADQYLAVLAGRDQIAALSPSAHNKSLSFFADRLKGIPAIRDDAESVLTLRPDLVIASAFSSPQTMQLLRAQGLTVFVLPAVRSLADIREQIGRLAAVLGRESKGMALIDNLDRVLEHTKDTAGKTGRTTALYYQRGGYASGPGSYIGMILSHLGLQNLIRSEAQSIAVLPLESVIVNPPDLLIVSDQVLRSDNQGAVLLNHPALLKLVARTPRIVVPMRETICPGPSVQYSLSTLSKHVKSAMEPSLVYIKRSDRTAK